MVDFANENALRHHLFLVAGQLSCFCQRIEMPEAQGVPDTVIADGPIALWVELKIGLPEYRPGQLPWAYKAAAAGQITRTVGSHAGSLYVLDTAKAADLALDKGADVKPSDFMPLMTYHISAVTLLRDAFAAARVGIRGPQAPRPAALPCVGG